jgi:hypothetical protein
MPEKKSIQFTVTQEEKEYLSEYAKAKGFYNVSALAKRAVFAYISKYPGRKNTSTVATFIPPSVLESDSE